MPDPIRSAEDVVEEIAGLLDVTRDPRREFDLRLVADVIEADRAAVRQASAERERRLLIALHDAIRRPLGVVPDSAVEFYDPAMTQETP